VRRRLNSAAEHEKGVLGCEQRAFHTEIEFAAALTPFTSSRRLNHASMSANDGSPNVLRHFSNKLSDVHLNEAPQ
jgi:hypothetical protein